MRRAGLLLVLASCATEPDLGRADLDSEAWDDGKAVVSRFTGRVKHYGQWRRAEIRDQQSSLEEEQAAIAHSAAQIIATSSTERVAGYEIVRQIEAVFTDGHATPSEAVEALKALAAERGGNAVINLASERPPSGRCLARGDAVIARPLATAPGSDDPPDPAAKTEEGWPP